jgi:hypothetical protein
MLTNYKGCRNRFGISHGSSLQEIKNILHLTKKQTLLINLNLNTKKIMKITQIFHGKLFGKPSNKSMNHKRITANKDHVINIQNLVNNLKHGVINKQ